MTIKPLSEVKKNPEMEAWDIDRYLTRIQFQQPISVDLTTLTALMRAHLTTVPFENLDIHDGKAISLQLSALFEKIVINGRGGFCYELNGLFSILLRQLGFDVRQVSARVANNEGGFSPEYDHLALIVTLDNIHYLVDVGFGQFATIPLPVHAGRVSDGPVTYQINEAEDHYLQVSRIEAEETTPEYRFMLTPRTLDAFAGMCQFHQTDPRSHFTQNRVISILTPHGRITLTDTQFKRTENGIVKTIDLEADQFEHYLKQHFGEALITVMSTFKCKA